VLRILIANNNASPSAGLETAMLFSSGKHANHYTTKDEETLVKYKTNCVITQRPYCN
jgi:hypothetical protein